MSFVAFVLLPLLLLLLLLLYLCLANINSWTAAGSSRAAAVWAGRGIERTNAKCEMRRRRFVQLGHCLCPPLWRVPSPRVPAAAAARVCVCVLVLLLSLNLLTVAAAAAVALYLPLLFVCLFICLLLLLNFVIIIIVGFLGKTRTHIVSEHDANDTFPQKHKQKQRQKQLQ